jgi:hypothetical protein
VSFTVRPVIVLVVDESGRPLAVWSNLGHEPTAGQRAGLRVRRGSLHGADLAPTQALRASAVCAGRGRLVATWTDLGELGRRAATGGVVLQQQAGEEYRDQCNELRRCGSGAANRDRRERQQCGEHPPPGCADPQGAPEQRIAGEEQRDA